MQERPREWVGSFRGRGYRSAWPNLMVDVAHTVRGGIRWQSSGLHARDGW